DAEAVAAADPTDPTTGGCSGFSWSKLTPFTDLNRDYVDNWNGTHSISSTHWVNGQSAYTITKLDSTGKFMIGLNAADHPYNPGKYSRFDWTTYSGELYFCQSAYAEATAADAEAVAAADPTDPTTGGCSGFSWSKLTPFVDFP
ncbi:MAG: hypothetical protein GY866_00455, partial [Proteobacteria bacterium]|nr:hypothetical protein [Pseudomonadota bacterium]